MENPMRFEPPHPASIRIQVQPRGGEWMTVYEMPSQLADDDGTPVEAYYWKNLCRKIGEVMDTIQF